MKKIYMILAAMSLLTMSLNAQLLPAFNKQAATDFTPTGIAYKYMPNAKGQFRMPSLGSGEYLFGPYTTDDFDATGVGFNYYNQAQSVGIFADMDRSEFESHLGDTIIGFRFALAGSSTEGVYSFAIVPTSANYIATDQIQSWNLGTLMGGNTSTQTETTTAPVDVTFTSASSATYSLTNNNVTITTGKNELGGYSSMYLNGTTTISTTDGTITKIVFNGRSDGSYPVSRLSAATGNFTVSNNVGTWTGSASSVDFSSTQDAGCSSIVVTVERATTTTVNTVEVGRGATKYEHLPVSGYNQDYGYHNQMIYRAGQLCMASGAVISSITFYPEEGIGLPFSGSTITVKLGNTTQDNFGTGTSGTMLTGLTTVATVTPVANSGATAWKIDFATPFTYTGNNLVVDISCPGGGSFAHTNFLGDNQSANVSLVKYGNSTSTSTTGDTNTFLPKATFTFTGSVNTNTYLTLQGGEWHDFFLHDPVVFNIASDTITNVMIGYNYYQQYSSTHTPVAYNSNSTGHAHYALMYASNGSQYVRSYWYLGESGADNTLMPGDLAVQLIFKESKQKTPAPTITYSQDNMYGHVTATATDPNATVTLTVGGQTATGTGSVTINIGRGDTDVTVTATATAQDPDKLVSDPTTETYVVQASPLDPTPAPTIVADTLDLTVQVNGYGQGEVHMYVDGQEVSNPEYLERGTTDYTVTVTVTALITDEEHSMSTTTQQIVVPALTQQQIDELITGWTELPGTYTNNSVINWNNYVMFIDRFKVSTAQNNHPAKYTYKMKENEGRFDGKQRSTNEHIIPVQLTRSKVHGFYTLDDVLNDTLRQVVDTCVMNAQVEMYLEQSNEIYYYTLDRSRNSILDDNFMELSRLQGDGNRYVEMNDNFEQYEPFGIGVPIMRYDTINAMLPAAAPQGVDGKHYGKYAKDSLSYVPIIWTFGNLPTNKRANWDNDGIHNSYGSPIWKTSVGQVVVEGMPQLERQTGKDGSTNWTVINGQDTVPCSIFMVTDLSADGYVPNPQFTNIKYEPYLFRVWVKSPTGKLRDYAWVGDDPEDLPDRPGTHYEDRGAIPADSTVLIWEEFIEDSTQNITFDGVRPDITHFHKSKVSGYQGNDWTILEHLNMMFAAPDNLKASDIEFIVRFYYRSTGDALVPTTNMFRALLREDGEGEGEGEGDGDEPRPYYGVEGEGEPDPRIPTFIHGVYSDGNHGEIIGVTYVNLQGMTSSKPFDGINIVVTRYSDGTTSTSKIRR